MKIATFLILACLLAGSPSFAETASIGSELLVIEGPPDLVQSLRDSYAAGRPKKAKTSAKKAAQKGKQRLAAVKKSEVQKSD